jgi:hypothetical protein
MIDQQESREKAPGRVERGWEREARFLFSGAARSG